MATACTRGEFLRRTACAVAALTCGIGAHRHLSLPPIAQAGETDASQPAADQAQDSPSADSATRGVQALPLSLMLATDLHYLSPRRADKIADGSPADSGSMLTAYTDPIADCMVATTIAARPHAFVMPGDLTFNGELESLEDLALKLRAIADAGIPVLVIPGNHDIKGAITRDVFAQLCDEFGRAQALACDADSLSYVYELAPAGAAPVRLLFVDVNAVEEMDVAPASTIAWVEAQLADARAAGVRVVSFTHQLLTDGGGYHGVSIDNGDLIRQAFRRYGMVANFCGHIHSQSLSVEQDGATTTENAYSGGATANDDASDYAFYNMATSCLSIYPLRYASIEIGTDAIDYRTATLDVNTWAAEQGLDDPVLLDFASYARQYNYDAQFATMRMVLSGVEALTPEEADDIADYFARVNVAYVDGTVGQVELREDLANRFYEVAEGTLVRMGYGLHPDLLAQVDATHLTISGI